MDSSTIVSGPRTAAARAYPSSVRSCRAVSNPPIKVGKDRTRELVAQWLGRLVPGGFGWLVVKQAMGADSLHIWLDGEGFPTERAASKQGYRILKIGAPPSAAPPRAKLAAADLDLVGRRTGGEWTMLGHLTGGWSGDQVYLVGRGPARAVLKLKHGAWWAEQLPRAAETVEQLRALGYPLATRALGAITRPVPALPTGDFVHGDFTPRNMLFDDEGLSAIVDLEGFGAGTRVIDLVALLQTAADPRHTAIPGWPAG